MLKTVLLLLLASATLCLAHTDKDHGTHTQTPVKEAAKPQAPAPKYISESPLPEGWPAPGPYNVVTLKKLPAYRAAYTEGGFQNFAFLRLFRHIKRQDIPMTSPVEMEMKTPTKAGQKLKMEKMAFLYRKEDVGKLGNDGGNIEVKDIPARTVLSYTWQGDDSSSARKNARKLIDAELLARKLTATQYRLLGYNGPGVPKEQKTWELQATIK